MFALNCNGQKKCRTETHLPTARQSKEIRRLNLIAEIEQIIYNYVILPVAAEETPFLVVRNIGDWKNTCFDGQVRCKPKNESSNIVVRFEHKPSEMKFTKILYILKEVYLLLCKNEKCSKRKLFYDNVQLFKNKQSEADEAMNYVLSLLLATPWELGIMPVSKGMIAGQLTFKNGEGEVVDCKSPGVLVPQNVQAISSISSTAELIIVIEKDTVFQKVIDENALENEQWLLITGKGFPDINTRMMVNILWKALQIPVYALVDADPHGIEIMFTYRYGSCKMAHLSDVLATPAIRWIGVYPTDISTLLLPNVLPLTEKDKAKIKHLQERAYVKCNPALQAQLDALLRTETKAEIESVASIGCVYLSNTYLPHQITLKDELI